MAWRAAACGCSRAATDRREGPSIPVIHDSKAIIPAPFIEVSRETLVRDDGKRMGGVYSITVRGKLCASKGSPNKQGEFWTDTGYPPDEEVAAESRLTVILKKQQALRQLFSVDGRQFEVSGYDGVVPFKCNPRVKRVEFPDGEGKGANWTEYSEYVVTLEADCVHGLPADDCPGDTELVSKFSEEWNLELLDENKGTYRLTRSLSATGRRLFDETGALRGNKEAWENARTHLLTVVGLGLKADRMASAGVLDTADVQAFNYLRTDNISESSGVCSVTESWVCFDPGGEPPALHDQTVTVRTNAQDGVSSVSVEGTVQGLEKRNTTTRAFVSSRQTNAEAKWNLVRAAVQATAQAALTAAGGETINGTPAQSSVGKNAAAGTVTYAYEYNDRPAPSVEGALSEVVTVSNSHPVDVFAQVPVLGRPLGPVLQGMETVTSRKRTVGIELQMRPAASTASLAAPDTGAIVMALMPAASAGGAVYVDQDEETWVPATGRYTRTTSFTYQ